MFGPEWRRYCCSVVGKILLHAGFYLGPATPNAVFPTYRIGLPYSESLVDRTLIEVSGTVLAARLALKFGLACNLAGGTHHAHKGFGSG